MKYTKPIVLIFIFAAAGFVAVRMLRRADDPAVDAAVTSLPSARTVSQPTGAKTPDGALNKIPARVAPNHTVGVAPSHVVANAISLSSFFAPSEVAGLTDEQIARLELSLGAARRKTYALLFERGTITHLSDGGVRIEIPAQGDALLKLREYVHDSIREIVGEERMDSFADLLGPKFDAKFAYFGKYPINIGLTFDGFPIDQARYVTMSSEYSKVDFLGVLGSGRMKSTSVFRAPQFEAEVTSLSTLKPKD